MRGDDENPEHFVDPDTVPGEKKKLSSKMAKQYSPSAVEKAYVLHFMGCRVLIYSMSLQGATKIIKKQLQ
ncbi:Valine--tRNA ligase, mitochondrial 1 [Linum grandiflorum]